MTYRGLYLVLSAGGEPRPYPASNLPALYPSGYGAYLYACAGEAFMAKSHRPTLLPPGWTLPAVALTFGEPSASLRLQAHIAATPLPSAILPLRQGGSGLCLAFVS